LRERLVKGTHREGPPGMRHEFDEPSGATPRGTRKAVFTLAEGDVVLLLPEGMSQDSVKDLDAYLKVWLRKIHRDAGLTMPDKEDDTTGS
jgi:hypothetical protein